MPGFIEPVLWVLFVAACVLISAVILLQEGKGGGLGEAFGGVGQQAFGVKAEGIQKFTAWVAVSVMLLAILLTLVHSSGIVELPNTLPAVPSVPGAPGAQAPSGGGQQPGAPAGESAPAGGGAPEQGGAPAGGDGN